MNEFTSNLKTVEESVYDAVLDILREVERDEANRLMRLIVAKLTTDIEVGVRAILHKRVSGLT